MADERKPDVAHEQDYIEVINKLKQNSVDREEYERLREDNKKLLDSIVNGGKAGDEEPETPTLREPGEIRKDLFGSETQSNLEFATKALELRASLIEKGEMDPFLPSGKNIIPTEEDIAAANRVADVLGQCVEYADGDNSVFTNELQRRTLDVRVR